MNSCLLNLISATTGGYIYDPTQNVIQNCIHLYIWMFLLCLPFIFYYYFPTTVATWIIYCSIVTFLVASLKLVNLSLHKMYDKARTMSETNLKKPSHNSVSNNVNASGNNKIHQTSGDCEDSGIEMQILNTNNGTPGDISHSEISCANSAVSIDYQEEQVASTIDLKVDVHRKNSSESSDNNSGGSASSFASDMVKSNSSQQQKSINHTRNSISENNIKVNSIVPEPVLSAAINSKTKDRSTENCAIEIQSTQLQFNADDNRAIEMGPSGIAAISQNNTASTRRQQYKRRSTSNSQLQNKLQRQVSLDSEQMGAAVYNSENLNSYLQMHRQFSSEDRTKIKSLFHIHHNHHLPSNHPLQSSLNTKNNINSNNMSINQIMMMKNSDSELYLENNYTTKSAIQLASESVGGSVCANNEKSGHQQTTPIRRDSNSTMSALQLPTNPTTNIGMLASTSGGLSKLRRHSNTAGPRSLNAVRRIKSAALETGCLPVSVSNLSPHPISVEVIGEGQMIRNPKSTILPLPSKLSRNPHLNLFPSSTQTQSAASSENTISENLVFDHPLCFAPNSDSVYDIAEHRDELQHVTASATSTSSVETDHYPDNPTTEAAKSEPIRLTSEGSTEDDVISNNIENIEMDSPTEEKVVLSGDDDMPSGINTIDTIEDNVNSGCLAQADVQSANICDNLNEGSNKTDSEESMAEIANEGLLMKNENSLSDWDQASASSKDQLIVKDETICLDQEDKIAKSKNSTKWFDSFDYSYSLTNNLNDSIPKMTTQPESSHEIAQIDGSKLSKADSDVSSVLTSSLSASQISTVPRNLGAIPKTASSCTNHRSMRKLSFGEEQYPTNKMYSRTLSQRSTSDRIPENNAIHQTSIFNNRNLSKNEDRRMHLNDVPIPPIYLPGGNANLQLYEQQTANFISFRSRSHNLTRETSLYNRRLRGGFGRPQHSVDLSNNFALNKQLIITMDNSGAVAGSKATTENDCNLCIDNNESNNSLQSGRIMPISHNTAFIDNSDVAINCFIDEKGHWIHLMNDPANLQQQILGKANNTISTNINQLHLQNINNSGPNTNPYHRITTDAVPSSEYSSSSGPSIDIVPRTIFGEPQIRPKLYKLPISLFGVHTTSMSRLQLLALFDRDQYIYQILLAIVLSLLVSLLGSVVLHLKFYNDIYAFIFCFVIAGSQYSLLKSVQPDASSPIHGFNKTVTYSRPIYFCVLSSLMLVSHEIGQSLAKISDVTAVRDITYASAINISGSSASDQIATLNLFGCEIVWKDFFSFNTYLLSIVILFLPVLFSLGLFPQVNTFLMYFFEQLDMNIFGGNAMCNLIASFLSVLRSLLACSILFGPVYGGLLESNNPQHILMSIFIGLLIPTSYHLSRSSSDFTHLFQLMKSALLLHNEEENSPDATILSINESSGASGKVDEKETSSKSNDENPDELTEQQLANHQLEDPLPKKLQQTVTARLKNDLVVCSFLGIVYFALHSSTIFKVLQPNLNPVLQAIAIVVGMLMHYILPQARKHLPCLCVAAPILKSKEYGQFEVTGNSKTMWFEKIFVYLSFVERNILFPLIIISAITADSTKITDKFGYGFGAGIIVVCSLKVLRMTFSDTGSQYLILLFTCLFFRQDFQMASETFLVDYFLVSVIFKKICDLLLKLEFVVTYIAPWQITWGSAFHAFAQPFSVPHSAMLFLQTGISAFLSTPLNPFLGSAIFLTSYARPIKFWERDYNTRRIDHSNTRLSSQLDGRDLGADDNNLNSIFYEHLTRSLQHSLCGDLILGRWGVVNQGDCFVLASDYLNCLVHIIEVGNGLCTFQMRGLEFRGTYCQQREVEAISEGVEDNDGCCCCTPGHLPRMLSVNAIFTTRWLAWQVIASQYVLEGYSISDNSAVATLQVFEFRKVLISYYVKSIIYYAIKSPKLLQWLNSTVIQEALNHTLDRQFVDLDPIFNHNLDEDYDFRVAGISRASFWNVYSDWIQFCCSKQQEHQQEEKQKKDQELKKEQQPCQDHRVNRRSTTLPMAARSISQTQSPRDHIKVSSSMALNSIIEKNTKEFIGVNVGSESEKDVTCSINSSRDSVLVSLCLSLTLLARRTLATASHSASSFGVEFFLHGLHSLFKGDFRITSTRDEWVFADMDLLHKVVAPAVRMSLKLHQDHFLAPEEYEQSAALYQSIEEYSRELVISHEADPSWRNAVLRGTRNLLALRHVMEDGTDEYRVIRLTKRFLNFRVIKLNRECVRGLWAGQQQELIYLRNRNPERGSIQNAKQALRNIINSSCDQPIGYPIYVSPLTTSYAETNEQLNRVIGGEITLEKIHSKIQKLWHRIIKRCQEGCSSGSGHIEVPDIGNDSITNTGGSVYGNLQTLANAQTTGTLSYGSQSISLPGTGNCRGSLVSIVKPTSSNLLAGLLNRDRMDLSISAATSGLDRDIMLRERSVSKSNISSQNIYSNTHLTNKAEKQLKRESFRDLSSLINNNSCQSNSSSFKQESTESQLSFKLPDEQLNKEPVLAPLGSNPKDETEDDEDEGERLLIKLPIIQLN